MDSRDLMKREDGLHCLVDTDSLIDLSFEDGTNVKKLLQYQYHDLFTFLRSEGDTSKGLLNDIDTYYIDESSDDSPHTLRYPDFWGLFRYNNEEFEAIQNRNSNLNTNLTKDELRLVAVRRRLDPRSSEENSGILITENEKLLKARRALESEFTLQTKEKLNIMSVDEAAECSFNR